MEGVASPAPMLLPQLVLQDHGGWGCSHVVQLSSPPDGLLVVQLSLLKAALALIGHGYGCLWEPGEEGVKGNMKEGGPG